MIEKVIEKLYPNTAFVVIGDKWESLDGTELNSELIVQGLAELEYEIEVQEYQRQRAMAYPNYADQFDQIFHEGINAWKETIQTVKDAHPKVEIDETELASRKAQALFDYQLEEYTKAQARLDQYQVALGREQVAEMQDSDIQLTDSDGQLQFDSDGSPIYQQVEVITVTAIDPVDPTVPETQYNSDDVPFTVQVENPLITKDNEERSAAQATIDATPQPVIDEYNS